MNDRQARTLIEDYVDGWKTNDRDRILSSLAPDCVIIESHGPTYRGTDLVRQWIESWFSGGSSVDRWEITSFHSMEDTAVFEWDFECTVGGQQYRLDGISIVEFKDGRISTMREYRRTEFPYEWTPK